MKWLAACFSISLLLTAINAVEDKPLTPGTLAEELKNNPGGPKATMLANRIRSWFGKDTTGKPNVEKGANPKIDELSVAWAIEVPSAPAGVRIVSADGRFQLPLIRVDGNLYAAATTLPDGTGFSWHYAVGDQRVGGGPLEVYKAHPDTKEQPGVPKGVVKQMPKWESKVFANTTRDWWVYVPAQYKPEKPACVMVFQDGGGYKNFVPTVFDNLIHKGDMPVTVGVFVQPGTFARGGSNRSFEYDTLSDQYSRFILEEVLPEVEKDVKLRHDANSRAIAGISSGGICAFTVAWERPNEFGKVLSWVGSFTNIASGKSLREGGHNYPALIRKTTPKKPIRVFLQDGANDLDNLHGSWPLANLEMDKALAFAKYDYKFVYGNGFHSNKHGIALLPDSLRWLWRDYKAE